MKLELGAAAGNKMEAIKVKPKAAVQVQEERVEGKFNWLNVNVNSI